MPPFWPGVDRWPPPKWVWIAAAVMTFVVGPVAILLGSVGRIALAAIAVVVLILGTNARLRNLGAEEFQKSRPED